MKKLFAILTIIMIMSAVYADENYTRRYNGYPQGTFKKGKNGKIIQYDKTGKKVGVYKINLGKY